MQRTIPYAQTVIRRLHPAGSGGEEVILSDRALDDSPDGAVIVASSGYGKTTLANFLARQSAERARADKLNPLPFYIVLPDAAATQRTILGYAQERLSAHCPQVSLPAFRFLLRSAGAVLLLDGVDRLTPAAREAFSAELDALRRDYRGLQIFVFSRASSRPDIGLPLLELKEYSDEEQVSYAEIIAKRRGDPARVPLSLMADSLRFLCKVPLNASSPCNIGMSTKVSPPDIKVLFRSWIEQLLQVPSATPSQLILREEALGLIAFQSDHGRLSGRAAMDMLRDNGHSHDILDDLIQGDALRLVGTSLELAHEAIGDYFRALRMARREPQSLIDELAAIELDTGSLLPVLLAALLERHDLQQALFRRLARLDLPTYFDALRYRVDTSAEISAGTPDLFAQRYLRDMLDGIEEPMLAFFPEMRSVLLEAMMNSPGEAIAILGNGTSEWVNYFFLPAVSEQKVTVGPLPGAGHLCGSNLRLLGLRADSGRLLGLGQLKEQLLDLPRRRALKGGMEWISERLIGRIRFLIGDLRSAAGYTRPFGCF